MKIKCYKFEGRGLMQTCEYLDRNLECRLQEKRRKSFKKMFKHCPLREEKKE